MSLRRRDFDRTLTAVKRTMLEMRTIIFEIWRQEGLSAREVAQAANVSERTVYYQWKLARKRGYCSHSPEELEKLGENCVFRVKNQINIANDQIRQLSRL